MVKFTTLSVCVSVLFFLHLVFFVHGKDDTNQLLVGNGDSAHMGRADHECRGKERGKCKKLGDEESEETLYENEDYIYTQSNP
ncbi:hypothetical protein POPTR_007G082600v4 [Populus trichocarpa]|uniref:Uncharacterized protein n=1 Tax=Populus trichocarpa TaxID=3694 RepID=A0A2K1ZR72_POPTR|nr:hypothetical protein BDE02_07G079300 [Populus trichocarpa]PNT27786.1 hypothetical protein POPTR_007G082600v4 [Populus trichocarpa]